jgi:peroxiredoxin
LVFVTPNCPACIEAGKDLEGLRKRVNAQVVVLCRGDASQCRDFGTNYSAGTLILSDEEGTIGERFKVKAAPTAVLLDDEGRVLRYGRPGPGSGLDLVVESIPGEPSGVVG